MGVTVVPPYILAKLKNKFYIFVAVCQTYKIIFFSFFRMKKRASTSPTYLIQFEVLRLKIYFSIYSVAHVALPHSEW